MVLPASARQLVRRVSPGSNASALRYLEYDLRELSARLQARDLECSVLDYPRDFWSRDFERTRSNLLITLPKAGPARNLP
jgi:hypothetical protein